MDTFKQSKLNMPPVKQFIKETMEQHGVTKEQAKEQYNRILQDEIWVNDKYQVNIDKKPPHGFHEDAIIWHLSVKRLDKDDDVPWRDLQIIKNELAGEEVSAMELYPHNSILHDSVNQRHLWAFMDGDMLPVGWRVRSVSDDYANEIGGRQTQMSAEYKKSIGYSDKDEHNFRNVAKAVKEKEIA